jgi:ABC-type nickel/cobalt efflux system permease component RcnA
VSRSDLGVGVIALSMLLALGFGALHAVGPGHGKTLMAAYLVGAGGRARQAVAVGGAVAVMHTASVLALGVIVLSLERTFPPERVYPWLGLASGLVALGLGAALLVRRLGAWANVRRTEREHRVAVDEARSPEGHRHAREGLDHDHGPGGHVHLAPDAPVLSRRGLMALAVAGGILPSPTALVVLLSAVSFQRVAFGLALIAMFSVGLAASLIVVGLLALRARDAVSSRLSTGLGRLVPVLSASVIVAVGAFLTVRGLAQV